MNYPVNATTWPVGSLVIHDADSKRTEMLMRVVGYNCTSGLVKTRYVALSGFCDGCRRGIYENELKYLHDPARFGIATE